MSNVMEDLRRQDDIRMEQFERQLTEVCADIRNIKENHLSHIERSLSTLSNDMEWIKRFFWILATASLGSFAANLMNILK